MTFRHIAYLTASMAAIILMSPTHETVDTMSYSDDGISVLYLSIMHSYYKKIIKPENQHTKTLFGSKGETGAKQWQVLLNGGKGDCDDYAATFRAAVLRDYPNARTWLYIGRRRGTYHAVAVIEVGGVKYQMDNLRDSVVKLDESTHDWKQVWNGKTWEKFKRGRE